LLDVNKGLYHGQVGKELLLKIFTAVVHVGEPVEGLDAQLKYREA
jgi:arginine utilization protein RocB